MATKAKQKKNDLGERVDRVVKDAAHDRERLSKFLDELLNAASGDDVHVIGIAEYVSKVADALTRQNQLRVAALKLEQKAGDDVEPEDDDEINGEIGLPFTEKAAADDGAN